MKVKFALQDHGWLDICISDKDIKLIISASYLSDSIEEMIINLCIFIENKSEVIFKFQTEPGEYRFKLKSNVSTCLFEIYELRDTFSKDDIINGICILSTEVEVEKLINLFYMEIEKLHEMGIEKYKEKWRYDFPQNAFNRLIKAMNGMIRN